MNPRKPSKTCNFPPCPHPPTRQATLVEVGKQGRKEVVDLHFFTEHYDHHLDDILLRLAPHSAPGNVRDTEILTISYVTY